MSERKREIVHWFKSPVTIDPQTMRKFKEPYVAYLYVTGECVKCLTEKEAKKYEKLG